MRFVALLACFCLIGCAPGSTNSDGPRQDLNVNVETSVGVTINWTTDQPTTSQVEYGITTAYANLSPLDPTLTTDHSVILTGLSGRTQYHYRILSSGASGIEVTSGDLTFTTQ